MTGFSSVTPPGWGQATQRPEAIVKSVEEWVDNRPLRALVGAFGGRIPNDLPTSEKLSRLDRFSLQHWDFRGGVERNLSRTVDFDHTTARLILDVATALGLVTPSSPTRGSYDHVLILGGLVRSCILRPRFAAGLLASGLRTNDVVALSAFRPLRGDEHDLTAQWGLTGLDNEMQAMQAGLVKAFGLDDEPEHVTGGDPYGGYATQTMRTWRTDETTVHLVVAPSPEPAIRRANTADTYAFWAGTQAHLQPGENLLLVTTPIYAPFQHTGAVRVISLPYSCTVETVGVNFSDPASKALCRTFTPANYLQEIRSTISGTAQLYAAASRWTP